MIPELRIISLLFSLFARYRFAVAASVILGILSSLAEGVGVALFIPFIQMVTDNEAGVSEPAPFLVRFLDNLFAGVPPDRRLLVICLGILGAVLAKVLLYYLHGILLLYLDWKMGHDIRSRLTSQILSLRFRDVERKDSAELLNTLSTESWNATDALSVVQDIMVTLCTLVVYIVLLLLISPQLTMLALLAMLAISGAVRFLTRHVKTLGHSVMAENTVLGARMLEIVEGNKIIRTFGRERYEQERFDAASERVGRLCYRLGGIRGLVGPVYELGGAAVLVFILYVSTRDPANLGSTLVFIFALYRTYPKIAALDGAIVSIRSSAASVDAVTTLLDQVDEPRPLQTGTVPFVGTRRDICFDRVCFKYHPDDRFAIQELSIQFPARQTTALVGPSGAGKSTVIKLLLRLYDADRGEIRVDGQPLDTLELASWREKIAVVSQDGYVFNATIRDNIAYGRLDASDGEIVEAAKRACAHDFISSLPQGYLTNIGDHGVRLSTGQVQRLTLARAIVRDPDILILDEATNSVDSISERIIQEALETFAKSRTVLIIAHRFSTIEQADNVVVLEDGRVREQGSLDSLLRAGGLFSRLHALQRFGPAPSSMATQIAAAHERKSPLESPERSHGLLDAPLISIVIPCYNHARFLGRAIESALAQTYPHYEVIVVDDGSQDDTRAVAARYPVVRYLRQEHQGIAAARNAGIDGAGGTLLVFLDADDRLLPKALEAGLECLRARPECGFVVGAHTSVSTDGTRNATVHLPRIGRDIYLDLLSGNRVAMHGSILFRRDAVLAAGRFDTGLAAGEDYDLCLRAARRYPAACHSSVVAEYWKHDGNMSGDPGLMLRESLLSLRKQRPSLKTDDERAAFVDGIRHWQSYYGELQWSEFRTRLKQRRIAEALPAAVLLLELAPSVFVAHAALQLRRTSHTVARAVWSRVASLLARPRLSAGSVPRGALHSSTDSRRRSSAPAQVAPVILLYHRVADVESDPWGLAVSPRNFREHMRILREERDCLPLVDLVRERAEGRLPSRGVGVTFDDGYSDNLVNAKPILREFSMPVTFFLTSGYIEGDREFWWDALERPFFQTQRIPDTLEIQTGHTLLKLDFSGDTEYRAAAFAGHRHWRAWDPPLTKRHFAYHRLWQEFHHVPSPMREKLLEQVVRWSDPGPDVRDSTCRPLSAEAIRELAAGPGVEIGGHSVTHPSLPLLDREAQEREILENKRCLEQLLGRPLRLFSYPHGEAGEETVSLVKEAGYEAAFTTKEHTLEGPIDLYRLPRICVEDWDPDEFARRLTHGFLEP